MNIDNLVNQPSENCIENDKYSNQQEQKIERIKSISKKQKHIMRKVNILKIF